MQIITVSDHDLARLLTDITAEQLGFVLLNAAPFYPDRLDQLKKHLAMIAERLQPGGLLFLQGLPLYLAELGVFLADWLKFKYWIVLESQLDQTRALPSVHCGLLLFIKGDQPLKLKQLRSPHLHCDFCKKTRKDWGGKSHLMHPQGCALSDIWTGLPDVEPDKLDRALIKRILALFDLSDDHLFSKPVETIEPFIGPIGLIAPAESLSSQYSIVNKYSFNSTNNKNDINSTNDIYSKNGKNYLDNSENLPEKSPIIKRRSEELTAGWINQLKRGDIIDTLKKIPDNSIDLAFADPPYNLQKSYNSYDDEREDRRYLEWCERWLQEYARIIKPTGSVFVLNLPRWSMHHAAFLNRYLYLQNWIVWDALAEPRGKLMPAHYGLLFYTKSPTGFTWNYDAMAMIDARNYCRRPTCLTQRKQIGHDRQESLTDLWWNIHRIRHQRDRDYHPCQLPDALLERIIRLTTNEGDLVLDGFCGVGTTPVIAKRHKRNYIGIDIDENYLKITAAKLADIEQHGAVARVSISRPTRSVTKKELQLALRRMAEDLGRLPTPADIEQYSNYTLAMVMEKFTSWNKALRAAKLSLI